MNNLTKATFRFTSLTSNALKSVWGKRDFTRTIWQLTKTPDPCDVLGQKYIRMHIPTIGCQCGCSAKMAHTKGERELVEFLTEEIVAERKSQKMSTVPTVLDGFAVKFNGADVELTKMIEKEKIVVSFNVNHTVDSEEDSDVEGSASKEGVSEMKSKPQFEIDIVHGDSTLSFTCSFLEGTPEEGEYNDVFGIDEMCMFKGEWNDKVYAVAGDVLDGYLYDLLMNLLEEKGINNEFVEKLSDLATAYEHTSYISLLENLSTFTSTK